MSLSEQENNMCSFEMKNCMNFRSVCPDLVNGAKNLYRSSRPDLLNQKEVDYIRKVLNIKCILDMRSTKEYKRASGDKLLDQYFSIYEVKIKKFIIAFLDRRVFSFLFFFNF